MSFFFLAGSLTRLFILLILNSAGKSRAHQKAQSKPTNEGYNLIECFVHVSQTASLEVLDPLNDEFA